MEGSAARGCLTRSPTTICSGLELATRYAVKIEPLAVRGIDQSPRSWPKPGGNS